MKTTQNTTPTPAPQAVLTIGRETFLVPPGQLEAAFSAMHFITGLTPVKDDYIGYCDGYTGPNRVLRNMSGPEAVQLGISTSASPLVTDIEYVTLVAEHDAARKKRDADIDARRLTEKTTGGATK